MKTKKEPSGTKNIKKSKIKYPPQMENITFNGDHVSFIIYNKCFLKKKYLNQVCFRAIKKPYDKIRIKCIPNRSTSFFPKEEFLNLIYICKKNGVIPKSAKAGIEDGKNYLFLNGEESDKHQMFAALCIWRWIDSRPRMMFELLWLLKQHPNLTFWETFHYALGSKSIATHTFVNFSLLYYNCSSLKLSTSIALKRFFQKSSEERKKIKESTIGAILKEIRSFTDMKFENLEELIEGKWSPLYKDNLTEKEIEKKYLEIKRKENGKKKTARS